MGVVRATVVLLCSLSACSPLAAQVQRFVLSQVRAQLPVMKGYVDTLDENGQPVAGLEPANFTATLGTNPVNVTGVKPFKDAGEGVAYVFLVDVSKSIAQPDFESMRAAMSKWIENLRPGDRVAICTFGDDYTVVTDFKNNKQDLSSALAGLAPRDMSTHLYQAIKDALDLEHRGDSDLPARRVMILLSDGKDEGSAITSQDVVHQLHTSHIPIFAVGYSHLRRIERRQYLDVLRRFAELSGGVYRESVGNNFEQAYGVIQEAILRVFIVDLSCAKCVADGRAYPLLITLSRAGRSLSSSLDVTPISARFVQASKPSAPPSSRKSVPGWVFWAGGIVLLAIATVLALKGRRKGKIPAQPPAQPQAASTNAHSSSKTAPEKGLAMKVAVIAGTNRGRVYDLRLVNTIVIGRAKDCDLVLDDARVSNRHCEVALSNHNVVIYDLDSKNSTFVKGVPIRGRHKLESEDSLLLGETELRLRFNPDEIPAR